MKRVFLVPVSLEHASFLQVLASDPAVQDTTRLPSPYPPNGAFDWISYILPRHASGMEYAFTIFAGSDIVGVTGFTDVDTEKSIAEFGYWIGRPFWGNGYATAAGSLALEFLFENTEIQKVVAPVLERNNASRRVLEKLGFEETSVKRTISEEHGEDDPAMEYSKTRQEWITNQHE